MNGMTRAYVAAVLGTLLLVALAHANEVHRGGKTLREGMELDSEQESALPDTSGMCGGDRTVPSGIVHGAETL